jgi:hypothetical protein
MFDFLEFKNATPQQRGLMLKEQAQKEQAPDGLTPQLKQSFRISKVLNRHIDQFIALQLKDNSNRLNQKNMDSAIFENHLNEVLNNYLPEAISQISKLRPSTDELKTKPKNLYELAGATELAFANRVTRNLSTTMGALWERIAWFSPYVVDPDTQFGVKIAGIDIILKNKDSGLIEYAQLKTQRNTLTGSQSGRADSELSLHDYPIFCACFLTKQSWTYNTKKNIPRFAGEEFWSRIGIDYNIVTKGLTEFVLKLEDEFISMLGRDGLQSSDFGQLL